MQLVKSQPGSRRIDMSISTDYMNRILGKICFPRPVGEQANEVVRMALVREFIESGFEVEAVGALNNVVAGDPNNATILVGAHYDSVPGTPGADDNGSAVAVMMAVARAVGPDPDVCFVAFNGEETNLAGSREFVQNLGRNQLQQVHVLEMVGYTDKSPNSQKNPLPLSDGIPTVGDFLGLVGTTAAHASLTRVIEAAAGVPTPFVGLTLPDLAWDVIAQQAPHVFRSDHAPFWLAGIPALMWTDTAEFRNPHYHQPSDTIDTLDFDFMHDVATVLAAVVKRGRV